MAVRFVAGLDLDPDIILSGFAAIDKARELGLPDTLRLRVSKKEESNPTRRFDVDEAFAREWFDLPSTTISQQDGDEILKDVASATLGLLRRGDVVLLTPHPITGESFLSLSPDLTAERARELFIAATKEYRGAASEPAPSPPAEPTAEELPSEGEAG